MKWKEIEGFSRYLASEDGQILDKNTGNIVSQVLSGIPQYCYVNVRGDDGRRKLVRVHRLIAIAFCDGRTEECDTVDHIDRDHFNNHYTNLRWTDRYGNNRNREVTIFTDDSQDQTIKEWVRENHGDTEEATYAFIYRKMKDDGCSFEEALEDYREYLRLGLRRRKVDYKGESWYLVDLCEFLNKDYESVNLNLRKGWDVWESIHNIPPISYHTYSFTFKWDEDGVVNIWYPSKKSMWTHLGISREALDNRLKQHESIDGILNHDPAERFRITVQGVCGTREEICQHFGVTLSAVETTMKRKGLSFEEAVVIPRQRIRKIYINGKPSSPKELWQMFNINPRRANKVRAERGLSFEEALEYFGKDITGITITY